MADTAPRPRVGRTLRRRVAKGREARGRGRASHGGGRENHRRRARRAPSFGGFGIGLVGVSVAARAAEPDSALRVRQARRHHQRLLRARSFVSVPRAGRRARVPGRSRRSRGGWRVPREVLHAAGAASAAGRAVRGDRLLRGSVREHRPERRGRRGGFSRERRRDDARVLRRRRRRLGRRADRLGLARCPGDGLDAPRRRRSAARMRSRFPRPPLQHRRVPYRGGDRGGSARGVERDAPGGRRDRGRRLQPGLAGRRHRDVRLETRRPRDDRR